MIKIYISRVSRRLKSLREEKNLTQEELADQLGISRQSIISVEKGKCLPSLPLALRIADIFHSSLEEIFLENKNNFIRKETETMPRSLMPWSPFGDLDRFFDDDALTSRQGFRAMAFPAVNVKQTEKDVILTADIPGIKDEELEIEVGDSFVDISGERKEEVKESPPTDGEGYFRQEVRYGSFARRIPLPAEVNPDKADATIKNGQLKLVIPKLEPEKPKTIKIKVKKDK